MCEAMKAPNPLQSQRLRIPRTSAQAAQRRWPCLARSERCEAVRASKRTVYPRKRRNSAALVIASSERAERTR